MKSGVPLGTGRERTTRGIAFEHCTVVAGGLLLAALLQPERLPAQVPAPNGPGYALSLDGVDDYVSVALTTDLNAYPLTLSAWVKTSRNAALVDGILSKYADGSANGYALVLYNGHVRGWYFRDPANYVSDGALSLDGGFIADGAWHHVTLVVDAAGGRLLVDGVAKASLPWTGTPGATTSTEPLQIGYYHTYDTTFQGQIDEVRVWSAGLTAAQIQETMRRQLWGNESGLVACWRFDEGNSLVAYDITAKAVSHVGELRNGPISVASSIAPFAPSTVSQAADKVAVTTRILHGSANPNGAATTGWFEWGLTSGYGNVTPAQNLGNGTTPVDWSSTLTGLEEGTTYYYRAVASSASGPSFGAGMAFQTYVQEASDVTRPGDPIVPSSPNSPLNEGVNNAIDDQPTTKYLNFDKILTGFLTISPDVGLTVVRGLTLTSANDAPERDPAYYYLWGSHDGSGYDLIADGDVPRFPTRFFKHTILFNNTIPYRHYQLIFPWVVDPARANSMQIAEVELLGVSADVTAPGDRIVATSANSPSAEGVTNAIDNQVATKYLNLDRLNTGFTVTPAVGGTLVNGLSLTSANDAPERDPASVTLEGSYDGVRFTMITSNAVPLFPFRFYRNQIFFPDNTNAYRTYRVIFPTVAGPGGNSMQIAETELLGVAVFTPPAAPVITNQPQSQTVSCRDTAAFSVGYTGVVNQIQWMRNGLAIAGANTATLTVGGDAAVESTSYSVQLCNLAGCVTSTVAALTVDLLACPTDLRVRTSDPYGTTVEFPPFPGQYCNTGVTAECTPPSGSMFPPGATSVSCKVTDDLGSERTCRFNVRVDFCQTSTRFSVNTPLPDGDTNGIRSTLTVSSPILSLSDVNVSLVVTGTFNGDLHAVLTHQSGRAVLLNRPGRVGSGGVGYSDNGVNIRLDDQAPNGDVHVYRLPLAGSHAVPIPDPGLLTGDWAPDGRATSPRTVLLTDPRTSLLGSFNGLDPNGEWTLQIADASSGDTHGLGSWGLELCGNLGDISRLPAITNQPQNQAVPCGGTAVFSIGYTGTVFSTQWMHNGNDLAGYTDKTLILDASDAILAGGYSVRLCNPAGCVTSVVATLTVDSLLCPGDLRVQTAALGTQVTFAPPTGTLCNPSVGMTCTPSSGSWFPVGATRVACVVTNGAGQQRTCSFTVHVEHCQTNTLFFVNTPLPDGDTNGITSTLTVSSPIVWLTDVNVSLVVTGSFNGDLYAVLTHQSGQAVLLNRPGRTGSGLGYDDNGVDIRLDDQALNGDVHVYRQRLSGGAPPVPGLLTGDWAPDGRATSPYSVTVTDPRTSLLSSFNGLDPNGDWTLRVADAVSDDRHGLITWGLELCGELAAPPVIFRITKAEYNRDANSLTLTWETPTTGAYAVEANTDLSNSPGWVEIAGNLPRQGSTTSYTVTNLPANPRHRFYRVRSN